MIAITFALPAESSGVVSRLTEKSQLKAADLRSVSGRLGQQQVHIVHTGVGETVARTRLNQYLENNSPSLLISSGFAGATRSNYQLGDLILAQNFSDPILLAKAQAVLRDAHAVVGWTANKIVNSPEEREQIWNQHQAVVVDMETKVVADICVQRRVPMLSLRVLSDTPRDPIRLPSDVLFDVHRQRTPMLRLFGYLVTHPSSIPELVRFSGQITHIRRRLTDAIVQLVQANLAT